MKPSCSPDLLNLLDAIRGAGASLWVDDTDNLHVWPVANVTNDQLTALKANKEQVVPILRQRTVALLPDEKTISAWQNQPTKGKEQHRPKRDFTEP